MSRMKITAGLGSIEDYPEFVRAGADEVFCGYVPESWMLTGGLREPLNRREVLYYNVQIGSESELRILRAMAGKIGAPVSLTFNSLAYPAEKLGEVVRIAEKCRAIGSGSPGECREAAAFDRFIVADPSLICELAGRGFQVEVSGEYSEINRFVLDELAEVGVRRVIFPRQTTIAEMRMLIARHPELEYEAFLMNERCQFTGAYCNSLHCDELCHMCRVPYRLSGESPAADGRLSADPGSVNENAEAMAEEEIPGYSGCGLCALWQLKEAGITHLKIVGRGNRTESGIADIRAARTALDLLEEMYGAEDEETWRKEMFYRNFPKGCGKNCYYGDRFPVQILP